MLLGWQQRGVVLWHVCTSDPIGGSVILLYFCTMSCSLKVLWLLVLFHVSPYLIISDGCICEAGGTTSRFDAV